MIIACIKTGVDGIDAGFLSQALNHKKTLANPSRFSYYIIGIWFEGEKLWIQSRY